jgi:hypothetical protein
VVCYRFAAYATPLRTVAAWQPARFSRGDEDEPTQYLALHPLGPLAELMRNAELRAPEQVRMISTRTWALEVPIGGLPEITFATAERFGISAEQLVGDDYGPCQDLALRLRAEVEGLIVPSAALPGTRNVVLFGPRVAAPYLTWPVSSLDIPASITADGARPPASLRSVVRFAGDGHTALHAWRNGTEFRFVEPDWAI